MAAHRTEVISAERLADALWGDHPPRSAGKLVQNLVLRLRKAVGRELIETRPGGYLLRIAPDATDAARFERLVVEGRELVSEGELAAAVQAYASALALWRGRPLNELADWPAVRAEVTRLEELRDCAEDERADAALALGRHRESVARLEALVSEAPLRERRWALLIVALYRSGRQADALRAYQRARAALGELGLEPGPELRAMERAVSAHDSSLDWHEPQDTHRPPLPTGVVTFLLTDVEGSSALWERAPEQMAGALERHDALIEGAVRAAGGTLLERRGEGDSTFSVFTRTSAAVAASVAARQALDAEEWPTGVTLSVRMAVHTGEAHERHGDYQGPTVNRAARLRDLAAGGQLLLSEAVATLIRDGLPAGWDLAKLGEHTLRGLRRPERVFVLVPSGATLDRGAAVVARSCPYMGLLPFRTEDDRLFFGRDDVVAAMLERLAHGSSLVLVGASGSGKSSLLRAGLVARLEQGGSSGREPWLTVVCTPTARPLAELAARLAPLCGQSATVLVHDLEADPRAIDVAFRQALALQPDGARLALVVDQLEELFTQCRVEDERRRFLDALVDVASAPTGRTVVVAALRADFFGHGAAHKGLAGMLQAHPVVLGAMDEEGLRAAIEGPAAVAGLTLEPGLADVILRDVTGEPGGLPLLSHALAEVWSRRQSGTLTIDGYRAAGGVAGAIARTAEAVHGRLDPDQQRVARDIFVRLTELGQGTDDTARRATVDELARDDPEDAARAETVLNTLAAARLVTVWEGSVEVAHEALIREWPRLRGWLDEDRDGLRLMRHLTVAAHEWDRRGRDDSDLYRGPRLAAAVEWHGGHGEAVNPLERDFLDAGRRVQEAQVREIAARNRRLRWLLAGTGVALVVALLAGTLAVGQRNRASTARDRAAAAAESETVGRLVAQSRLAESTSLDLALLLALEANRRSDTPVTRGALQSALVSNPQLLGFLHGDAPYASVSISPAGIIAAGTAEGTVDLWDGTDRRLLGTLAVGDDAVVAAFDPDGTSLAALSETDHSLSLWDVDTRTRIGRPLTTAAALAHGAPLAFSPDGQVLSAALGSGEIATWDVATGAETGARLSSGDDAAFRAVAYSPDGRWLAAASDAGGVTLYDARTRQPDALTLETGPTSLVIALAFDRHGTRLAAATAVGPVYAWDLTTGQRLPIDSGPAPDIFGQDGAEGVVAFSPPRGHPGHGVHQRAPPHGLDQPRRAAGVRTDPGGRRDGSHLQPRWHNDRHRQHQRQHHARRHRRAAQARPTGPHPVPGGVLQPRRRLVRRTRLPRRIGVAPRSPRRPRGPPAVPSGDATHPRRRLAHAYVQRRRHFPRVWRRDGPRHDLRRRHRRRRPDAAHTAGHHEPTVLPNPRVLRRPAGLQPRRHQAGGGVAGDRHDLRSPVGSPDRPPVRMGHHRHERDVHPRRRPRRHLRVRPEDPHVRPRHRRPGRRAHRRRPIGRQRAERHVGHHRLVGHHPPHRPRHPGAGRATDRRPAGHRHHHGRASRRGRDRRLVRLRTDRPAVRHRHR